MAFSREEADQVAAQLMEAAPPNVPSNGRKWRQQAPTLKSARSGSFKGLFGFNRGEALLLATPSATGQSRPGASCSQKL